MELATWNPERQLWETDQASLFSGQPEPFSETWPTSGMTRSGSLSPLPPSGRRTGGSGSSSSPTPPASSGTGPLLPTPTAMQAGDTPEAWLRWKNGRRKVGDLKVLVENPELMESGGVLPVRDEMTLLPTPRAAQGETRNSNVYAREGGDRGNLESALANVPSVRVMLPTPAAVDGLGGLVRTFSDNPVLPKPRVKREDAEAEGNLLPTPAARDFKGVSSPAWRGREGARGTPTLPDALFAPEPVDEQPALLPTPCAGLGSGTNINNGGMVNLFPDSAKALRDDE